MCASAFSFVCVVSGTITEMTELARKNTDLKEGDRVMALVGGGGYAGKVTVPFVLFSSCYCCPFV